MLNFFFFKRQFLREQVIFDAEVNCIIKYTTFISYYVELCSGRGSVCCGRGVRCARAAAQFDGSRRGGSGAAHHFRFNTS